MNYADDIASALLTPGGHLAIGRGGFTLHYGNARLSGYDGDAVKSEAIAAGLPVIDSRLVPFAIVARLAIEGPMVAVNRSPDSAPWHAFSSAPLAAVAAAYRQVGADVHNVVDCPEALRWFADRALAPLDKLIDDWLVRAASRLVGQPGHRGVGVMRRHPPTRSVRHPSAQSQWRSDDRSLGQ